MKKDWLFLSGLLAAGGAVFFVIGTIAAVTHREWIAAAAIAWVSIGIWLLAATIAVVTITVHNDR